jgi:hypothetical protein
LSFFGRLGDKINFHASLRNLFSSWLLKISQVFQVFLDISFKRKYSLSQATRQTVRVSIPMSCAGGVSSLYS